MSFSSAMFVVILLATVSSACGKPDPLRVTTSQGQIQGVDTGLSLEWRAIPYAEPPVGIMRWRPPQPRAAWADVLDGSEFAEQCSQLGFDPETETEFMNGSEDCLFLNVFAPAEQKPTPMPVMVHLHGGSNWGFRPYRDADAFTSKGVVVVTVGYRLGVFGFVGHPDLSIESGGSSGEFGLLDQIAALKWVRDNIAAFGGDPENITLFGESAGSFDAAALVASPLAAGLFHRAALQTESFWALHGEAISTAESLGLEVSQRVGCSTAPDVPACLRGKAPEDLLQAAGYEDVAPWEGGLVLPDSPLSLIEGQEATVPLLVGSNREEALGFGRYLIDGDRYQPSDYVRDTDAVAGLQNGPRVRELYRLDDFDTELWAAHAAFTDAIYTCPMRRLALASSGSVWRYLYTHRIENAPGLASLRAAHFLDEPILWQDAQLLEGFGAADYEFTAADQALSEVMAMYWTNFAKTGDPNGAGAPAWPPYGDGEETILVLGDPITTLKDWRVEACTFFDAQTSISGP